MEDQEYWNPQFDNLAVTLPERCISEAGQPGLKHQNVNSHEYLYQEFNSTWFDSFKKSHLAVRQLTYTKLKKKRRVHSTCSQMPPSVTGSICCWYHIYVWSHVGWSRCPPFCVLAGPLLQSPVGFPCLKVLVESTPPLCAVSCKTLPGHSVDVDSLHISYAYIFISQVRAAGGSPPQCQLTVEDVFWNATILHTANMTQPSQSALPEQSVHTGKTSTRQDITVSYFLLPGYAQETADASQVECAVWPSFLSDTCSPCLAAIQQCAGNTGIADSLCLHRQLGACPHSSSETSENWSGLPNHRVGFCVQWEVVSDSGAGVGELTELAVRIEFVDVDGNDRRWFCVLSQDIRLLQTDGQSEVIAGLWEAAPRSCHWTALFPSCQCGKTRSCSVVWVSNQSLGEP